MFLQLASGQPEHYLVVDARAPVDEIAARIRTRVEPLLEPAVRHAPERTTGEAPAPAPTPAAEHDGSPDQHLPRPGLPAPGHPVADRSPLVTRGPAVTGAAVEAGSVWSTLVGQRHVVETLTRAADGHGMTHAWLFTGPPGSGRSNAALAFAAALQCVDGGCGDCHACQTALAGSHPDVSITRTETSVICIDDMRDLVHRSALSPVEKRWQVMVIEDADRLGERAGNTLLKAIEEPTPKTVWLLCAPTLEDVLPTIRSRARDISLTTPTAEEVAGFLIAKDGVSEPVAAFAARASQGHIGRARALALDEATRNRRREVVALPARLTSLGACMNAAANLVDIAKDETEAITDSSNSRELAELDTIYGDDRKAKQSRSYKAALRELTHSQKQRQKRRRWT